MAQVYDEYNDTSREVTQEEFDLFHSFFGMIMEYMALENDQKLRAAYERWRIEKKLPLAEDVRAARRVNARAYFADTNDVAVYKASLFRA